MRYPTYIEYENEKCFDALLNDINEYSEMLASKKYKGGMKYFEEKLNLIYAGKHLLSYKQAKYFFDIMENVLYIHEKWTPQDVELSCFVACSNPVKLLIY